MLRRALTVAGVALALSSAASAQKFIGSPAQDLFDQATFYLDTQYFGPSTVNITDLIAKYQTKVDDACAAQGVQCGYDKVEPLLDQLFAELQDYHAYYMTPDEVRAERANASGNNASPSPRVGIVSRGFCDTPSGACQADAQGNLTSKLLPDRMVTNVIIGGPADKAGVKYGDRWVGYNGTLFSSFDTATQDYLKFYNDFGARIRAGETVTMMMQRGADKQRVDIPIKGEIINLVEQPVLELRSDGVAILKIRDYLIQGLGQRVHDLLRDAISKNVKAVIVNMRDNGGGYSGERALAQGALMENPEFFRRVPRYNPETNTIEEGYLTSAGAYVARTLKGVELGRQTVNNPQLFKGPIAVLVNGGCASACEYFASAVQRAKRGPVIGETTLGIGDTNSARFNLADGGAAAMPTVRAFWTDGTPLPSHVTPDIATPNYELGLFNTGLDSGLAKAFESVGAKTLSAPVSSVMLKAPSVPDVSVAQVMDSVLNTLYLRAPSAQPVGVLSN